MIEPVDVEGVKDRAYKAITTIFANPKHQYSLKTWLDSVALHASTKAWRTAVKISPTPEMFGAAIAAGAYDDHAILVPEAPTRQWVVDRVHARGQLIADTHPELVGMFVNIHVVTRDGEDHFVKVPEGTRPWPSSREEGEALVVKQVVALLGLEESE